MSALGHPVVSGVACSRLDMLKRRIVVGLRPVQTARWGEFVEREPELSEHVLARLSAAPCYLATVRKDGWPRVHPVGVNDRSPALVVVMYPTSPKGHDLRRSGMYALHGVVEDNVGGGGEVLITGTAVPAEATEEDERRGWIAFELLVGEVLSVRYVGEEATALSERWSAVDAAG